MKRTRKENCLQACWRIWSRTQRKFLGWVNTRTNTQLSTKRTRKENRLWASRRIWSRTQRKFFGWVNARTNVWLKTKRTKKENRLRTCWRIWRRMSWMCLEHVFFSMTNCESKLKKLKHDKKSCSTITIVETMRNPTTRQHLFFVSVSWHQPNRRSTNAFKA